MRNTRSLVGWTAASAAVLLACGGNGGSTGPPAQQFGTVAGTVLEADNTPVVGAQVTITRTGFTSRQAATSAQGAYQFTQVETGMWSTIVTPPGGYTVPGASEIPVNVQANQTATANFVLAQDGPPPGETHNVVMANIAFSPTPISIAVNDVVRWTNNDAEPHNVVGSNFSSPGNLAQNGTYERQFTAAGTFDYVCTLHAGMTGSVIVN
jgi:plastocyanin